MLPQGNAEWFERSYPERPGPDKLRTSGAGGSLTVTNLPAGSIAIMISSACIGPATEAADPALAPAAPWVACDLSEG